MIKKLQFIGIILFLLSPIIGITQEKNDVACLASVIYHESGNQSLQGQEAVAEVIINRVQYGFAKNVCAVVKQHVGTHWQFGSYTFENIIPKSRRDYFFSIAQNVLNGTNDFNLSPNVLYFNNIPFKSKRYKLYCVIGQQRFYTITDTKQENILNIPLYGSHEVLLHQNEMAKKEGLEQIKNDKELKHLVDIGSLVPIPISQKLLVDKRLPINRRYCRPWTAQFLSDISVSYYQKFKKPLVVDSAVRPVSVQKQLIRINHNAAAITGEAASPHMTGISVDISKHNFSKEELEWMRNYLLLDGLQNFLDVEEEFRQRCFHISVYKEYV
jgi:hypothetical protein